MVESKCEMLQVSIMLLAHPVVFIESIDTAVLYLRTLSNFSAVHVHQV